MGNRASFSNQKKYDKEIQKRRREIKEEISAWSQSTEFSGRVEEIFKKTMKNNDEIKSLSLCLHEHEPFFAKIKEISEAVFEECDKSNRLGFIDKWKTEIAIALLSAITTVLATRFFN